jgi:hypothetical protein
MSELRRATAIENGQNRNKHRTYKGKRTSSRFKGVSYSPRPGRKAHWFASIVLDGRHKSLGYHMTEELASAAYDEASARLHGDFHRFNDTTRGTSGHTLNKTAALNMPAAGPRV